MSIVHILCGLLSAAGAQGSQDAGPGSEPIIEILIAGPEEARRRAEAAIRPSVVAPDIRWTGVDKAPLDGALPEPDEQSAEKTRQIWIDVSNPLRLRVYLPATEMKGATTVRTFSREKASGKDADEPAYHAVSNIVSAGVANLRRGPGEAAGPALATPAQPVDSLAQRAGPKGLHAHDGFYLRVQAGYGKLTAAEAAEPVTYSKLGPSIGVAVGWALVPNLVLYGELLMTGVANTADRFGGGRDFETRSGNDIVLSVLGPGIAYYFMPLNLYVSATLGLAKLTFVDAYTDHPVPDSSLGYAASFTVGKDWWNSADWGVGIAARLSYAGSMKHTYEKWVRYGGEVESTMHATVVSLLISATYN